jgi:hypothetical protein
MAEITPTQSTYSVEVPIGTATTFADTVQLNTGEDLGTLSVSSNCSIVTFDVSSLGTSALWKAVVTDESLVSIPIIIDYVGSYQEEPWLCYLNWVLRDDDEVVLHSGVITLSIVVTEPTATTCPLAYGITPITALDLRAGDSGTLTPRILLDRPVSEINAFTVTFTLPTDEAIVSFVTPVAVTGVDWDTANIDSNPQVLVAIIDNELFAQQYLDIPLAYDIPLTGVQETYASSLTATTSFDVPTFGCDALVADILLRVILTGTSGGFEVTGRVATGIACETINIYDESNYGADLNHDLADFSLFRKITITDPSGVDYVMSSIAPYDELITPAVDNILAYPADVTSGGIYIIKLISVPTFVEAGTYYQDDMVCVADGISVVFYKSLLNNNTGNEPVNGIGWEDYWEEVEEEDILSAYYDTQYYVQWCDLTTCRHELESTVFCSTQVLCNSDLCDNECFQAFLKLEVVERMLSEAEALQWYDKMIEFYNLAKQLCDCNNPCR